MEPDASYAMHDVSEHMKVPIATFSSWCEKVRAGSDWLPSPEHFSSNARAFPPELEATLADFILLHFVSQRRALTRPTLTALLLLLVQDFVVEGALESQVLDFKGSYHFMSNVLNGVGLSFRQARTQRRPILDNEECAHFMANMITAHHRYPRI
jgi:hypothetical protein